MYNLICFPHYTCGGVLSDILNNTWSEVSSNGGLNSIQHYIGKIGDSNDVFVNFNHEQFYDIITNARNLHMPAGTWIGTHCWPGSIDFMLFNNIINVTTTTFKSKVYRWARAYHHYFLKSDPWQAVTGIHVIDKKRETAKNYLSEFCPVLELNIVNIEFAEIVELKPSFLNFVQGKAINNHFERWKKINYFLYEENFWTSEPVQRFYEAEYEQNLKKMYEYY
jgi:hypothetical protein